MYNKYFWNKWNNGIVKERINKWVLFINLLIFKVKRVIVYVNKGYFDISKIKLFNIF